MASPAQLPVISEAQAKRALGLTDGRYEQMVQDGVIRPQTVGKNRDALTYEDFRRAGIVAGRWAETEV